MRTRLLMIASALLVLSGCSDEQVSTPACVADAVIEGTITGTSGPVAAHVLVVSSLYWYEHEPETMLTGDTDADGRFLIPVPAGTYRLQVEAGRVRLRLSDGGLAFDGPADSIRIRSGDRARVALSLGSLTARLQVHPTLEGQRFALELATVEGSYPGANVDRDVDTVRQGAVAFTFPFLPEGRYAARLIPMIRSVPADTSGLVPGSDRSIWLGPRMSRDPAFAESIRVRAGAPAAWSGELADAPGVLRGRISGAWRALRLDPPQVSLWAEDSTLIASGRTGIDGGFAFVLLRPEPVKVRVVLEGVERWLGGHSFAEAPLVDVPAGGEVSGLDLDDAAIVVELTSERFVESYGMSAEAFDASGRSAALSGFERSRIVLPGLDPGSYRIRLRPPLFHGSWLGQWIGGSDSLSATPVTVGAGEVASVTAVLVEGGQIGGVIRPPEAAR